MNILLGVSGSVATIKADQIVTLLQEKIPQCNVQVLATEHSIHFLDIDRLRSNGVSHLEAVPAFKNFLRLFKICFGKDEIICEMATTIKILLLRHVGFFVFSLA